MAKWRLNSSKGTEITRFMKLLITGVRLTSAPPFSSVVIASYRRRSSGNLCFPRDRSGSCRGKPAGYLRFIGWAPVTKMKNEPEQTGPSSYAFRVRDFIATFRRLDTGTIEHRLFNLNLHRKDNPWGWKELKKENGGQFREYKLIFADRFVTKIDKNFKVWCPLLREKISYQQNDKLHFLLILLDLLRYLYRSVFVLYFYRLSSIVESFLHEF